MKFRLHVVYADDDAISTLPRPRRRCCAFLSESLTQEREVGASVPTPALLCPLLKVTFTEVDGGDRDGHRDLGRAFVNSRQNATIWPLMSNL